MSAAMGSAAADIFNLAGVIDSAGEDLEVMDINLDEISEESDQSAQQLLSNISSMYFDKAFMDAHPSFKSRVDAEVESFKLLYKLRRVDEVVQDTLIKSISSSTRNASLYKALSDMQRTILSITAKMEESTQNLEKLMKEYQVMAQADPLEGVMESQESEETPGSLSRGTRDFIRKMTEGTEV